MSLAGLRQAAPYIRLYRGQTFVVKVGGEAVAKPRDRAAILEQLSILNGFGVRVVLIHGGGPQATALAGRLNIESTFVEGRRVTNAEMLDAMVMSLCGTVRTELLATARSLEIPGVGVSGVDAGLVKAEKRTGSAVDYGFVGDITDVDSTPVTTLLDAGFLPVVSPICCDSSGQVLNVNADTFAAKLAIAVGATKLILVTGARGILKDKDDPQSLISVLTMTELDQLLSSGALKDGMLPKSSAITQALCNGVPRVHVVGYEYEDSILTEVFTNEGCGTMITKDDPS